MEDGLVFLSLTWDSESKPPKDHFGLNKTGCGAMTGIGWGLSEMVDSACSVASNGEREGDGIFLGSKPCME